jgi:hypothetical protein
MSRQVDVGTERSLLCGWNDKEQWTATYVQSVNSVQKDSVLKTRAGKKKEKLRQ